MAKDESNLIIYNTVDGRARRKTLAAAEADAQELFEATGSDELLDLQNTLQKR